MKRIYIFLLLSVSLLMTGCYSHRGIGFLQEPTDKNKLPRYDSVAYEPYRIHVNDEVSYRLITMDEEFAKAIQSGQGNSGFNSQYAITYRVYPDGTIDVPFLDPVHIVGLTEVEAQDTLKAAFRRIIPDAEVKLSLANKQFTVVGEIGSGRYYIYKDKLNIFQALAMTGDVRTSGDRKHVRIIRPRDGGQEPEILEFDLRTNTIIDSKYYYVYPNDVIYVARTENAFFKVTNVSSFMALITSSVALFTTVINYAYNVF